MANQQCTDAKLRELALFAGGGGGIWGGKLLGWTTVCAVERDLYAAQLLAQRQNDGTLEPFPIWADITTFDGNPWRGCVDVVSGGFPCQDISAAGKGAGITGERSGLWKQMARIIGEVRPEYAFIENSPMLVTRGLDTVLCDLAALGFDAEWGVIGAHHTGAIHRRDRIWILAHHNRKRQQQPQRCEQNQRQWPGDRSETVADNQSQGCRPERISTQDPLETQLRGKFTERYCTTAARDYLPKIRRWRQHQRKTVADVNGHGYQGQKWSRICSTAWGAPFVRLPTNAGSIRCNTRRQGDNRQHDRPIVKAESRWPLERDMVREIHGVAHWKHRIRVLGNGQVPRVVKVAWLTLMQRIQNDNWNM